MWGRIIITFGAIIILGLHYLAQPITATPYDAKFTADVTCTAKEGDAEATAEAVTAACDAIKPLLTIGKDEACVLADHDELVGAYGEGDIDGAALTKLTTLGSATPPKSFCKPVAPGVDCVDDKCTEGSGGGGGGEPVTGTPGPAGDECDKLCEMNGTCAKDAKLPCKCYKSDTEFNPSNATDCPPASTANSTMIYGCEEECVKEEDEWVCESDPDKGCTPPLPDGSPRLLNLKSVLLSTIGFGILVFALRKN